MKKSASSIVLVLIILAFVAFIAIVAINNHTESNVHGERYEKVLYHVESGDTLWSIAEELNIDDHMDIREWIFEVEKENNMINSYLDVHTPIYIFEYVG